MIAGETQNGLLRLGITHEKTLPYSPYQNGKQEIFWAQLEGRLMAMLCQVKPLTMQFLNQASQAWVELEYNRRAHEGIGSAPLDRMLQGGNVARPAIDSESMRFAFTVKEQRTQRRSDGTVSIKGVRFEIPSSFRRFGRLWVAYQSWDLSLAYLVDHRTGDLISRIYPQDKTKNSQGYRRAIEPESKDPEVAVPTNEDPIPPLLRKLLADYAATGVPGGYLPMEEKSIPDKSEEKDHEQ